MPVALLSLAFLVAAVCAAVMGYAIQRGATCMVAAVDEVLTKRRADRFIGLAEAAVWVAGGVLAWAALGGQAMLPIGYPATLATVAGGLLLGFGALVTRACVFGAIAKFGSGDWVYVLTPIGFYIGCATIWPLLGKFPEKHVASPLFEAQWLLVPFALFAAWRLFEALRAARAGALAAHIWTPHRATAVIGIVFVISLIAIGPWAYTYALLMLAQGKTTGILVKVMLLFSLFAGALLGGWTAGLLKRRMPTREAAIRCLGGGILMGWGSLLIPGGNDELLLVGLPLLQPYAWLAVASMAAAIALGQSVERRLAAR
ncbi:YeeE/YedE thiosulfate transporter family protein [Sandarakinorhabdus sp.]|uniref:YeeE/YedE thiosulfate transporter family protein n=1 Tax=Sandarakinorhabdus sp. TaxID=1916663 RepID=UPI00286DECA8|nr:YeeE/YedE thiosulfate transporter family protein [Sandarakinorhabdus sp.]